MAITQLELTPAPLVPAAVSPGLDGPGLGGPGLGELVAEALECLARAAQAGLESVDDTTLAQAVTELAGVESRAVALRLALSAEADRRRVADQTAETGTDAWIARLTGTTRQQAAGGLRIARLLQDKYLATQAAFTSGALRVEQVTVIVNAAEQAPAEATGAQITAAEQWLVAKATGVGTRSGRGQDARRLRQSARRMFAALDVDLADRHEAILLGRETRTAQAETYLALHDNGDGSYTGRFRIPELAGHLLTQTLDRLTAPRRLSRDTHGNLTTDPTAPGTGNGANLYETRGAALCELIEHLPTHGWPGHGGNNTEIIVTIDHDTLLNTLTHSGLTQSGLTDSGVATLDGGIAITASQARRLACGAGLIPAVLDSTSMPLDLGRSRRLHTRTQRRALALLHDTCAITGCERPFAWCEIHHWRLSWHQGGPTNLDNGLPLCGHHHQRAHDPTFNLTQKPHGEFTFHRRT